MMRLELRCTPRTGRCDLAWLADLTGSLDEICDFLLRAELTAAVQEETPTALSSEQLQRVVDGRAIQIGSPIVRVRDGPLIVELAVQLVNGAIPVQVLTSLGLLFTKGPELAAWPGHVKAAWYAACRDAEQVWQAYARTREASIVEVIEDIAGSGRKEVEGPESEPGRTPLPGSPGRRQVSADLPPGVRRAPSLDS
ncbi:MAG: hypothetical protein ACT4NY_03900 [Pseudonocardiales bacterium]